jgi:hypothetical protein
MTWKAGAARGSSPGAPTHGDRLILYGLLLLLAAAASLTPIRNFDYWWHLASGSWILGHGTVPTSDPFSFTAEGTRWVDHEWLFQVMAYLGHVGLGPAALVALKTAGVLLLCLLLARHLEHEGHGPSGIACLLAPVLLGAAFRLDVRPELATLFLAPVVLHLVLRARAKGSIRPLLAVPPLVALWANLHVGVIVAPAILVLGLAGTVLAERVPWLRESDRTLVRRDPRFTRRLALVTLAASLAVGLNPYGLRIYAVPFELSSLLRTLPWPNHEWVRPGFETFPLFWIACGVSLGVLVVLSRRIDPMTAPAFVLASVLAASHLRNIGLFFVLLPYALGRPVRALADNPPRRLFAIGTVGGRVRPGFITSAVVVVLAIALVPILPPGVVWGAGIASGNEPASAADFLEREGVGARLYNDVLFGGYLIWRRFPGKQVFIDGRNEIYGPLLGEIAAALPGAVEWNRFIDRHHIDAAFLRYAPTLQRIVSTSPDGRKTVLGDRAFSAAYFPKERWALVYWDDDAMIFLMRTKENEKVIGRLEYRAIHPEDWQYEFAGVVRGGIPVAPILEELRRKLAEDPSCTRASGLLARFDDLARDLAGSRPAPAPPKGGGTE